MENQVWKDGGSEHSVEIGEEKTHFEMRLARRHFDDSLSDVLDTYLRKRTELPTLLSLHICRNNH